MKKLSLVFLASSLALLGCPDGGTKTDGGGSGVTVTSSEPANGATEVSITTAIELSFSEAMNVSTVKVSLTPSVSLGEPTWNAENTSVTFTPASSLNEATGYVIKVTGQTPAGAALEETSISFTTIGASETTPPSLVSSVPANMAADVSPTTAVSFTFSEAMDQASMQFITNPVVELGTATWSTDGTTVSFAPPAGLAANTGYSVDLSGADLANNPLPATTISFTSGVSNDTVAPTIVGTSPASGATGVAVNARPSVTFSERMAPGTTAAFSMTPNASCMATLDATGTVLSCDHMADLPVTTLHTVTIRGADAKDLSGNALVGDFSFTFTTGAVADTVAPTIVDLIPSDGGIGFPRTQQLTAVFSEAMDRAATQGAISVTSSPGSALAFSWNDAGTAVVVSVDGGFMYGETVAWGVGTGAQDLAGISVAAKGEGSFRVVRLCEARIPSDGDGTFSRTASILGSSFTFTPSGRGGIVVGTSTTAMLSTRDQRGFVQFSLGKTGTGCRADGLSTDARGIASARFSATQTAVTGTPFGIAQPGQRPPGNIEVEPVAYSDVADAGTAAFNECSPTLGRVCPSPQLMFSSPTTPQTRTLDVTKWVDISAVGPVMRDPKLQLRLKNDYAEGRPTSAYSTLQPGGSSDAGAHLDVSYEYP